MAVKPMTLSDLLPPDWRDRAIPDFEPRARYYAPMDCVIYLKEDLSYRADRVDDYLTLLWHPHERRAIGIKIKGFRFLFERLRVICSAQNLDLPERAFVPLVAAVELAMTVRVGSDLTKEAEQNREGERARFTERYEEAREMVRSVQLDAKELEAA